MLKLTNLSPCCIVPWAVANDMLKSGSHDDHTDVVVCEDTVCDDGCDDGDKINVHSHKLIISSIVLSFLTSLRK